MTKKTPEKKEKGKKGEKITDQQKLFVHLYLGIDMKGKCYYSAALSYFYAYYPQAEIKEWNDKVKKMTFTKEYNVAKGEGYKLLAKPCVKAYKDSFLMNLTPEDFEKRHRDLAMQNDNLQVARAANADVLKMTGKLKEDSKVDIPQLEEIGETLKTILSGGKPKK